MTLRTCFLGFAIVSSVLHAAMVSAAPSSLPFQYVKISSTLAYYPEGPEVDEGGDLLFAEMPRNRIRRISKTGGSPITVWEEDGCGPTSVKAIPAKGGYWVLCHLGAKVVRLDARFKKIEEILEAEDGSRVVWPNDASVDKAGNVYFSSSGLFSKTAPPQGRVLRIDVVSNRATVVAKGLHYSNGVLVDGGQGRVLVSEHLARRVVEFQLDQHGGLESPRAFFDLNAVKPVQNQYELAGPDGIRYLGNNFLAVAEYGAGRLHILTGSGQYLGEFPTTYRFVTNMAISQDRRTFFVLSTRDNSSFLQDGAIDVYRLTWN